MTAPTLVPDPTRCPDCEAALTGTGSCPACGLLLTGPDANRLWEVERGLLGLERSRRQLLAEREALLQVLRQEWAPVDATAPPLAPAPAEWTPQRVQNLLLALGGLLLAGAALVFAVVTYERLGAGGRAAVLATLTLVAGVLAPRLRSRGLVSTAETVGVVALAMAALDAYGLRTLGLADGSAPLAYAAGSAAVLAVGAGAYGHLAGLRIVRGLGVVLAQLPVPLLLADAEASAATSGLALAALAGADLAALATGRLQVLARVLRPCAVVVTAAALGVSLVASEARDDVGLAVAALVACAAVLVGGSRLTAAPVRGLLTGAAVVVLGAAVQTPVRDDLPASSAALAVLAVVVTAAALRLPRTERTGPVVGALLLAGTAVAAVGDAALQGVVLPLTWVLDPWTLPAGAGAREAVGGGTTWTGPAVTPLVLLVAAAAAALAGVALRVRRLAAGPVAALGLAGVVLVPLALDAPWPGAIAGLLVVAAALGAGGAALLGRVEAGPLAAAGVVLALHATAWSTASQTATLVVLPLVALGCAALAVPRQPQPAVPVGLAGLLATAHVGALGAALDLAPDQVGGLLLVAVAGALLAAALLDDRRRPGAEGAALVGATAALNLAAGDVGWLSWVLAGLGLLALATALRPDRRAVGALGGLLLSASSWVRLADAGVTAPEPYVLPLAVAALVLGALRRRSAPATSSWAAYGPGLLLALVPSLVAGLEDDELRRLLLVGLAALLVLLVGARGRLQAPLTVGAGVLVVVALDLVGPYAVALPRWLSLGGAGTLLLVVGATYEQRRRDLARLREGFDALA